MQLNWIIASMLIIGFADFSKAKGTSKPIDDVLTECCEGGEILAEAEEQCSNFRPPEVDAEVLSTCFFTSEICCSAKLRNNQCKKGVLSAKEGKDCHSLTNQTGSDFYKNCCEACKIGLFLGTTQETCKLDNFVYGQPFDDAYEFCCSDVKSGEEVFVLDDKDICGQIDRLCSQICENTDGSYVCKCHPGFQLQEDKVSCLSINNDTTTEDNEVLPTGSDECLPGFLKNDITGECEDIDECESGEVTCNIETQVCYNTPGSYKCLDVLPATTCPDGYKHNPKSKQCEDINECLEQTHNCNNTNQLCLNKWGGYHCQVNPVVRCAPGFRYDDKGKRCRDINECETKIGQKNCGKNKDCVNTPGSFECVEKKRVAASSTTTPFSNTKLSCAKGFKQYFDKCVDIDECAIDKYACDSNQVCVNIPGSFHCECKNGFTMDKVVNACVDVNECQINNHDCLESQRCDNTIGSYTCIRLQSCGTGYTLNAGTGYCDDDDECILGRHNCVLPYECRNTKGSFRCDKPRYTTTPTPPTTKATTVRASVYYPPQVHTQTYSRFIAQSTTPNPRNEEWNRSLGPCNIGFERNSQGACSDIDECFTSNPCRRNQRCLNTNGSYRCMSLLSCSGGYTSNDDGTQCIDIDECALQTSNCGPDEICRNKPGGYTCSCPAGHTLNSQKRCEDINECEFYKGQVCPVNAICVNNVGSYHCDCKEGFKKQNPDDKMCIDIDECQEIPGLCSQRCINYWGSYRCACDSGFRLNTNNRTCEDIDECEVHKSYNLCSGICQNTPGSYQCTCPFGYTLGIDGRTCQDIDECSTDNVCIGRSEICTNVKGGYRCSNIICPAEYMHDPDHKNRCKRISLSCEHGDTECLNKPTSYSYNFITAVSNMSVPPNGRGLFTYKGPSWYESIDFDLKIIHTQAPPHVKKANEHFFSMHKMHNEALLSLTQTLEGPQDIELELSMTVFKDGQPAGSSVAKLFIIVSEYDF